MLPLLLRAEIKNHDVIIINSAYTLFFTVSAVLANPASLSLSPPVSLSLCVWVHYTINIIIKYNCMLQLHSALKAAASVGSCAVSPRGHWGIFGGVASASATVLATATGRKTTFVMQTLIKMFAALRIRRTKAVYGRGSGPRQRARPAHATLRAHRWNLQIVWSGFVFLFVITKFWNQFERRASG